MPFKGLNATEVPKWRWWRVKHMTSCRKTVERVSRRCCCLLKTLPLLPIEAYFSFTSLFFFEQIDIYFLWGARTVEFSDLIAFKLTSILHKMASKSCRKHPALYVCGRVMTYLVLQPLWCLRVCLRFGGMVHTIHGVTREWLCAGNPPWHFSHNA